MERGERNKEEGEEKEETIENDTGDENGNRFGERDGERVTFGVVKPISTVSPKKTFGEVGFLVPLRGMEKL